MFRGVRVLLILLRVSTTSVFHYRCMSTGSCFCEGFLDARGWLQISLERED